MLAAVMAAGCGASSDASEPPTPDEVEELADQFNHDLFECVVDLGVEAKIVGDGIEVVPGKRITDWKYSSGMSSAAQAEKNKVISAIKVEWKALGKTPRAGDKWRGNLFRCIGKDPVRGYLAWQPTMTKEPAFHVPDKFGWFEFVR
jgi:hypothetical protein